MKHSLQTVSNGLFLIFLGVVFLLINYGILAWNFWWSIGNFWPVILIVVGLGLVFNRRVPLSLAFLILGILMTVLSFFHPAPLQSDYFGPLSNYRQESAPVISNSYNPANCLTQSATDQ